MTIDILRLAKLESGYTAPASAFSESVLEHRATVPAAKRWFLTGGIINRDASETVQVYVKDASDQIIHWLSTKSAATGSHAWPEQALHPATKLIVMDPGWYVQFLFGGNQGAGAYLSCAALEIDYR